MTEQEIDKLIINCAQNNDALERLYYYFKADVFALSRSVVKTKENAEDALQETFMRLRRSAVRYKPSGKGKTYILKIASNVAHEIYRKNRPVYNLDDFEIVHPGNDYLKVEAAYMVERLMRYLNPKEMEIITLKYYNDLTFKQISEILEVPVSTAKWRLESAFAKLRNHGIDIENE